MHCNIPAQLYIIGTLLGETTVQLIESVCKEIIQVLENGN